MILAEQNKISYDDAVSKYVPELGGPLNGITIRHLLNHTSGIPTWATSELITHG
jgi:CubicO group peptidase (beta-lactamase class C family)